MEMNRLFVPTLWEHTDMFRPTVSSKDSKVFLFNPQDSRYRQDGTKLLFDEIPLSKEELISQAKDHLVNRPIEENVLVYGIFSYLYWKKGLQYYSSFEIGISDISHFFGVTMGEKGFRLFEKLQTLEKVFGVVIETGEVYPLLTVHKSGTKLIVSSEYMHKALNRMIASSKVEEKPFYYTDFAYSSLVASKNKVSALIVIELVRLIVSAGRNQPRTSIYKLEQYVPQLRALRLSDKSNSLKNRDLKRIFKAMYRLLSARTKITSIFNEFTIAEVIPTVNHFQHVIRGNHKGYKKIESEVYKNDIQI